VSGMLPHMGFKGTPISRVLEVGNVGMSTVITMIEGPEAVSNVEFIAAVEGVDVVLVGTNDLSIELGYPGEFEHPSFAQSMQKISTAVKKHKKILGIAGVYDRPDLMRKFIHVYGARFVIGHGDLPLLAKASAGVMAEMRVVESAQHFDEKTS
jgi:2-keto-3-deoxy-L-rhamnonate aldolase RhmA